MKVLKKAHNPNIATVYIARTNDGYMTEFVESLQPPLPRSKKWVIILSSLIGCPIECRFCEAGGDYKRALTKEELFFQIRYVLDSHNISNKVNTEKFKIQFARIGEPSFNKSVLALLCDLPSMIDAPGILPCISTIAPRSSQNFFKELLTIKKELYQSNFQLQFSIHSTDEDHRNYLLPSAKWTLKEIAEYGNGFFCKNGRKITLNFAPAHDTPICPDTIKEYFDNSKYLIKFTPVNPTSKSRENNISSLIGTDKKNIILLKN